MNFFDFEENDNRLEFTISNIQLSIINGLRRTIYRNIKTHRIDKINIIKNNTNMLDSIIKHRLSLIPIETDGECKMSIKMENNTTDDIIIKSKDINILNGNPNFNIEIPLIILKPDDNIDVNFSTNYNNGLCHSKYKPAICFFKIIDNIILNDNLKIKKNDMKKLKKILKNEYNILNNISNNKKSIGMIGFYKIKKNISHFIYNFLKKLNYDLELNKIDKNNIITLSEAEFKKKKLYRFQIEAKTYKPSYIFLKSIKLLIDNINMLKNIDFDSRKKDLGKLFYIIEMSGEYNTIANILVEFLIKEKNIEYIGFNEKHPLSDIYFINVKLKNNNIELNEIFNNCIKNITKFLDNCIKKYEMVKNKL